ncbi:thiol:disulfide interchange protein DsbA/DsbL [Aliikangiella marina]|uniref:Thiol:disulfide interchange protein n=1 Tax=Aliikangiella marina TaxID=1712262 RepID=A0A545T1D7_9GAMM|nr:thiol:disulfide interchange protein DsbA/DsbL [Aliikangiella marina]TQV71038.1 thiol:disulfide interchange protein DsbA/DsbL [Aliikangiella marina]
MKLIKGLVLASGLWAAASGLPVLAAQSQFVAGEHYEVTTPKGTEEPLLEEFFNYACGACYSIEAFMSDFKSKNPNIPVKMVPLELNPAWKIYVKAYFIGEKLGVLDKSHSKLFHRIHVEKRPLKGEDDMKAFFVSLGVSEKAYDDVAKSYWLNTQLRTSRQYAMKNRVMKTPTLLVNKKYKLDNAKIGTYPKIEQAIIELSGVNKAASAAQ